MRPNFLSVEPKNLSMRFCAIYACVEISYLPLALIVMDKCAPTFFHEPDLMSKNHR